MKWFWSSISMCVYLMGEAVPTPATSNSSRHQFGFLQFNSILTHLPGDGVRSNKLRAQSHKTAHPHPLQMPITRSRLPTTSVWLGYKLEVLTNPSSGSINLLGSLTELRETLIYVYRFTTGCDKGYRWTARWRDTQGKVGGSWDQELCPRGVGVHHPPSVLMFTNLEALQTPYY